MNKHRNFNTMDQVIKNELIEELIRLGVSEKEIINLDTRELEQKIAVKQLTSNE